MRITHKCIRVERGDMVIMSTFGNGDTGPSRRVTQYDWLEAVVPSFVNGGARRVSHSANGDCVWVEDSRNE